MLAVCFQYTEIEFERNQWDYVLSNFRPDKIFIQGNYFTGIQLSKTTADAEIISDISELPKNMSLVVMAPKHGRYVAGEISLDKYEHPLDAIYYFGPNSRFNEKETFENIKCDKVYIPTSSPDDMYNYVAYAVTAYDRFLKWQ